MPYEGIAMMVRRMTPTRYTVKEAAELVGRSPDTLVRWRKEGVFTPSDHREIGSLKVYLYTDADIEAMRRLIKNLKPGRKAGGGKQP